MNCVVISGFVARDVDLRYTSDGVAVATVVVAVRRPHKQDETDFFDCTAWRAAADNISKYFSKGDFIQIRGYLTIEQYTVTKDGEEEKRTKPRITIEEWGFGGGRKDKAKGKSAGAEDNGESKSAVAGDNGERKSVAAEDYGDDFIPF